MMHRQSPPRQGSFAESVTKMRESLTKSLSFSATSRKGFKSLSNHNHTVDEMNVFASDIVSKDYIMDRLKDIRHNSRIVKLEVEDLLIARTHDSFLPVVKALLVTNDRQWKYLRFVDTIPSTDFLWWQGMKHVLMREYEDSIEDLDTKYANTVSFQANIQVMTGATKQSISALFRSIIQDEDVNSVSFCGALFGYHDSTMAPALTGIIDEETGTLDQAFVINVKCGWQHRTKKETAMGDDLDEQEETGNTEANHEEGTLNDWSRVLRSLHRALRQQRRSAGRSNPQEDSGNCMEASERTHTTVSVSGASAVSTESAQSGSSGSSHRTPRSSRHGRRPRGSHRENLPIVQGGTRRCVTLPAAKDGSRSPIRSPVRRTRPVAQRAKSFQLRRPALGILDSEGAEAPQTKSRPQRASSFNAKNTTSLLGGMTTENTSELTGVADIDNLLALPDHQPAGALDAWLHNEKKPSKDVAAKVPVRKSSHHSRRSNPNHHHSNKSASRSCSSTVSSSKSPGPPLRRTKTTETDGTVGLCHHSSKSKTLPRRSKSLDKDCVQCVKDALSAKGVPSRTRSEGHAKMLKRHTEKSHRRNHSSDGREWWDSIPDYDWSNTPDYDWSIGDYVEKKVVPRAA